MDMREIGTQLNKTAWDLPERWLGVSERQILEGTKSGTAEAVFSRASRRNE